MFNNLVKESTTFQEVNKQTFQTTDEAFQFVFSTFYVYKYEQIELRIKSFNNIFSAYPSLFGTWGSG